eukprot:TRINITY_DN1124_c0_g1_i10.p1 TRINITY_DN1124_c0_g1~~TRINITY_DN1124_c0_g1_i10.p1  ORF type:complete len:150 (+),score=51.36 TRINITY_DN1124_c0_g1_i10:216-665(+)
MKAAWDKLGDAYAGSSSVVIGDVDCTSDEGKSVCNEKGVSGYPTIKYYTDETGKDGEDYSGGRDFDALDKFVKEKLAKKCDVKTHEDCDEQEKAYIAKMVAKGADAVKAEAKRLEGMKGGDMKPDKKAWLMKRISILNGLSGGDAKEEL